MPVSRGVKNGKPYYQWGSHGKLYYYIPGNLKSRETARMKAEKQGNAAYANGYH